MSSTIKLYEHNQNAYAALLDMLGERDRAYKEDRYTTVYGYMD